MACAAEKVYAIVTGGRVVSADASFAEVLEGIDDFVKEKKAKEKDKILSQYSGWTNSDWMNLVTHCYENNHIGYA